MTNEDVAVKIESSSSVFTSEESVLRLEYEIYKHLRDAHIPGVPRVYPLWQRVPLSTANEVVSLMIMERLGPSLQSIMKQELKRLRLGDWPIF